MRQGLFNNEVVKFTKKDTISINIYVTTFINKAKARGNTRKNRNTSVREIN